MSEEAPIPAVVCPVCARAFRTAADLGQHTRATHANPNWGTNTRAGKIAAAAVALEAAKLRPPPSPDDIEAALSPAGGFTRVGLASLGVKWPPRKGWRRDLEANWEAWVKAQKKANR